jgi:hypothetical protein
VKVGARLSKTTIVWLTTATLPQESVEFHER